MLISIQLLPKLLLLWRLRTPLHLLFPLHSLSDLRLQLASQLVLLHDLRVVVFLELWLLSVSHHSCILVFQLLDLLAILVHIGEVTLELVLMQHFVQLPLLPVEVVQFQLQLGAGLALLLDFLDESVVAAFVLLLELLANG